MKKVLVMILVVIVILTGLFAGSFFYYHNNANQPLTDPGKALSITVQEEESLYQILDRLEKEGQLKNAWLSKLYYRLSQSRTGIVPGRHEIPAGGSLRDLLKALQSENLDNITFTIPEGFTIRNMAKRIGESGLVTEDEFLAAVRDFVPPSYVPEGEGRTFRMEGYLRPDTYSFARGTKAEEIVKSMNLAFSEGMNRLVKETGFQIQSEDYDVILTKASMIERETNVREERTKVASVIENRLAIGMRLQLDATILYARGVDQKVITMEDIYLENPYNTYYVPGLPLGPICSPSDDSMKAVLTPADTEFLYYLLNPATGHHFFTSDYAEFEKKRDEYYGNGASTEEPQETTQAADTIPENPFEGPEGIPFEIPDTAPETGTTESTGVTP